MQRRGANERGKRTDASPTYPHQREGMRPHSVATANAEEAHATPTYSKPPNAAGSIAMNSSKSSEKRTYNRRKTMKEIRKPDQVLMSLGIKENLTV